MDNNLVLVGKILGPHGVRGQVKLWSYTENPYNIISYGPLSDKTGTRKFTLSLESQSTGGMIARIDGVTTREAAEELKNTELYIPRAKLPEAEQGEYYQHDLIGLKVTHEDGSPYGILAGFHNFGAGTIAEIRLSDSKNTEMFAFNEAVFPVIDMAAKRLVIRVPEMMSE